MACGGGTLLAGTTAESAGHCLAPCLPTTHIIDQCRAVGSGIACDPDRVGVGGLKVGAGG